MTTPSLDGRDAPPTSPPDGPRHRRRFRLIYVAPVFALIALIAWALASPMGSSPDDDFHLASIWCGQGVRAGICEATGSVDARKVPQAIHDSAQCFERKPEVSAACQATTLDFSPDAMAATARGNFTGAYPPLYYAFMSMFVGPNIVTSVIVMRIVNALLFVGITSALFALLPHRRRSTLLWAWLISTVPLGLFLLASNNPSSWAIIGIGSAWIALHGYFESAGWRKLLLGVLFVVVSLMAAGARGDSAVYVSVCVALVMVLLARRTRAFWLSSILPLVMCVVGLVFYFASNQSAIAVTGLNDGPAAEVQKSPIAVLLSNLLNVPSIWAGIFGSWPLGWFDTVMPAIVTVGAAGCFVAVAFSGMSSHSRRKTTAIVLLALVLWLLPTYVLLRSMNLVGTQVQPRYLLPLLVVFAGLAVLQVDPRRLALTRLQCALAVVALAAAQGAALYYDMRRYITGTTAKSWNLDSGIHWWWNLPVTPMMVWIGGSIAFAALVVILVREIAKPHALR